MRKVKIVLNKPFGQRKAGEVLLWDVHKADVWGKKGFCDLFDETKVSNSLPEPLTVDEPREPNPFTSSWSDMLPREDEVDFEEEEDVDG